MKVLLAGDGFVTENVLREAFSALPAGSLPDNTEFVAYSNSWPVPPFHDIGEVKEAQGDEDELIAALQDCQAVIAHTLPFTEKVIKACPQLKLITICRGGPVNVNIAAATANGVGVCYTPGRNATATAEHSVAMILAAANQIAQRHREVVEGQWRSDYYLFDNVGPEIGSSTVGLVGYGAVGRKVAQIMSAFDGKVLVYDPWAKASVNFADLPDNLEFVDDLSSLLQQSQILSLHARVTPENQHMINADTLALLPAGAILVNCARGALVDYDAVCDAIDSGHLFAAAFDCLPEEPLPTDHRLARTPRVTFTPHLAGASKEAARLAARIGAKDVAAFLRGEQPKFVANPEVWS